jgi:hypothetical protein
LQINGGTLSGQHAVVADGDVEITGNINYSFAGGNIPSLYIAAKGNIYIDNNVTSLAGIYVAQPTGTKDGAHTDGIIFTCAQDGVPVQASSLFSTCNEQLVIDGAFIAQKVQFLRSFGTVRSSDANEDYDNTKAAEVFKASPSVYLSGPPALQYKSNNYDSITSLPPIL